MQRVLDGNEAPPFSRIVVAIFFYTIATTSYQKERHRLDFSTLLIIHIKSALNLDKLGFRALFYVFKSRWEDRKTLLGGVGF